MINMMLVMSVVVRTKNRAPPHAAIIEPLSSFVFHSAPTLLALLCFALHLVDRCDGVVCGGASKCSPTSSGFKCHCAGAFSGGGDNQLCHGLC